MAYSGEDDTPTRIVALSDILCEAPLQIRREVDRRTVDHYASAYDNGDEFPPITLARWNGALVLVDGWHRVGAHKKLGRPRIAAVVREVGSFEELSWLAASANLTHGKPLFGSAHREVFHRYIRAGCHQVKNKRGSIVRLKSYREIATDLRGIRRHTTIQNWMNRDFPQIAERMSGAGPDVAKGVRRASDPESQLFDGAKVALDTVANAIKALSCEERRGVLIAGLEGALADLKSRPHKLPPPPEF